jgi:hypothetical protein
MKRQNRFDYYKPLTITMFSVGVGLILASLILPRIVSNDKSDEIKKEADLVHTTPRPENPTIETATTENADAEAKQKGNTVSTSTSVRFDHPHPTTAHQDNRPLGNNPVDLDESDPEAEGVILDENDYLDENGNVTDWEKWCLARMHKNGWFKPEDVPIINEDPNGHPDGAYIWTEYEEAGHLSSEEIPEDVKMRAKALKEELDYATEIEDGREAMRIMKELHELHKPYRSASKVPQAYFGSIPPSWLPYFQDIANAHMEAVTEELRQRSGR